MTAQNFLSAIPAQELSLIEASVKEKKQLQQEKLAIAIASQNHLELEYDKAVDEVYTWLQVALLARKDQRDDLLLEALRRQQIHQKNASNLKVQLKEIMTKINCLQNEVL